MIERYSTSSKASGLAQLTPNDIICMGHAAFAFAAEAVVGDTTWAVTEVAEDSTNAVLGAVMKDKL